MAPHCFGDYLYAQKALGNRFLKCAKSVVYLVYRGWGTIYCGNTTPDW